MAVEQLVMVEGGLPIKAPDTLVYSTAPQTYATAAGVEYVVKGPEPEIVVPEVLAHLLAAGVGITVPDFAVTVLNGHVHFASRKLVDALRDAEPFVASHKKFFAELAVFDVWICNWDRNIGNVLVRAVGKSDPHLVAIDFEKAQAMKKNAVITSSTIPPAKLKPTGTLQALLRGSGPSGAAVDRIHQMGDAKIVGFATDAAAAVPAFHGAWQDSVVAALQYRKQNLRKLTKEVYS